MGRMTECEQRRAIVRCDRAARGEPKTCGSPRRWCSRRPNRLRNRRSRPGCPTAPTSGRSWMSCGGSTPGGASCCGASPGAGRSAPRTISRGFWRARARTGASCRAPRSRRSRSSPIISRSRAPTSRNIRGVAVSKGALDVLMEAGWVRMRGRRKAPGRPITYGTTSEFLVQFGLDAIGDLPGLDELQAAGLFDGKLPPGYGVPQPSDEQVPQGRRRPARGGRGPGTSLGAGRGGRGALSRRSCGLRSRPTAS